MMATVPRREAGSVGVGSGPVLVTLDSRRVLRTLAAALLVLELLLVYLDVVVTYFEAVRHEAIQDLCNLVLDSSMGNWFSSVQTLGVALALLLIFVRMRAEDAGRPSARGWAVLAGFFLYMAFDDGVFFHESVGTAIEDSLRTDPSGELTGLLRLASHLVASFPSYPWQLVFLPFLGGLGVFVAIFTWRELNRSTTKRMALAGLLCFVVAVGLDYVEGLETPYATWTQRLFLHEDTIPHFSGVLEELIEMIGTTLLLYAFLDQLLWLCRDLRLRTIENDEGGGP